MFQKYLFETSTGGGKEKTLMPIKSAPLCDEAGGSLFNVFFKLLFAVRFTRLNRNCVIVIKLVLKF